MNEQTTIVDATTSIANAANRLAVSLAHAEAEQAKLERIVDELVDIANANGSIRLAPSDLAGYWRGRENDLKRLADGRAWLGSLKIERLPSAPPASAPSDGERIAELERAVHERAKSLAERTRQVAQLQDDLCDARYARDEAQSELAALKSEYTRAAVAYAEAWASPPTDGSFSDIAGRWRAAYDARHSAAASARDGEKAAPAPADGERVLECWVREYEDRGCVFGYTSAREALQGGRDCRAHRVAVPILETVVREGGAS